MRTGRGSNTGQQGLVETAIRRFRLKLGSLLTLKYSLSFITVWGFTWGLGVLLVRFVTDAPSRVLLWGLVGILLAVGIAVHRAWRRLPTHSTVAALLDREGGFGGLLMAAEAQPIGSWQDRLTSMEQPRLRWRSHRAWVLLAASLVFVVAGFFMPVRFSNTTQARSLDVGQETSRLAEQIETLKAEDLLDVEKAEALEQKLDQVRKDASGHDPGKTWEALDHLEESVSRTAKQAGESAVANTEALTQSESLAVGLKESKTALDEKLLAAVMQELSAMLRTALKDDELLQRNLSKALQEAIKSGTLCPAQLQELLAALRQGKGDIAGRLQRLRKAGLIDLKTLKACEKAGQCNSDALAAFLAQCQGNASCDGGWYAGRGGVSRGRGDAEMTWTDGSSEDGTKFKEVILPPSAMGGLENSQLIGLSTAAPTVESNGGASSGGALSSAAAGGGSAFTQTVLPRHRGAVKRYFQRK